MKIAGVNVNSFVDMKGKIAYVIFTPGCNFDCWYCHNRHIINKIDILFDNEKVLEDIKKRAGFIDIVVISGGEPTLQEGLTRYIERIRAMGFKVKLDTNGSNPLVLRELIDKKLVDYVAMDIKAPFIKYAKITGSYVDIERIKESILLLTGCGIDYEFRTTFSPDLAKEDIVEIAKSLEGARLYIIQQYVPGEYVTKKTFGAHSKEYIESTVKEAGKYLKVEAKGIG